MFKTILLAIDGSDPAKRATKLAAGLAAAHKATLVIVSVSPLSLSLMDIESTPHYRKFPKAVKEEMRRLRDVLVSPTFGDEKPFVHVPAPASALVAMADALIENAEAAAKRQGVKTVRRVPLSGHAADEILDQAKSLKADLLVMGTRGLSKVGGMLMGSVSQKVVSLAPCPCLTVK